MLSCSFIGLLRLLSRITTRCPSQRQLKANSRLTNNGKKKRKVTGKKVDQNQVSKIMFESPTVNRKCFSSFVNRFNLLSKSMKCITYFRCTNLVVIVILPLKCHIFSIKLAKKQHLCLRLPINMPQTPHILYLFILILIMALRLFF